jgi:hypothetical protein
MSKRNVDVIGWIVAPFLAASLLLLPLPSTAVDAVYSRGFYWWLQRIVTNFSNAAPFAWIDIILFALVILVIWRTVRLVGVMKEAGLGAAIWEGARRIIRAAGVMTLLFLLMWGLNYRRLSLDDSIKTSPALSVNELRAAIADADALGARLRPVPRDIPTFDTVIDQLRQPLNTALTRLGREPLLTAGVPKYSLILTPFFTWAGVDGMVNPYALESIVHPDLLPFERPIAIGHEWAHLAGAADEADASAIGWLACMNGGPELAYSATVYLIVEAGGALPHDVWMETSRHLDPGIRADLASMAERQLQQRPSVQRAAFSVYDQYLRANHVDDGVANYSHALALILSPAFRDALSGYRVVRDR